MHSTVPEYPCALLADLENIECSMLERYGEKQRSKDKAATARPEKGKPNKGASKRGSSIQIPKKAKIEKLCQKCKTDVGPIRLTIQLSVVAGTKMVSLSDNIEVSHPRNISPTKRMGAKRGWRI
jgi:hypothetical protein